MTTKEIIHGEDCVLEMLVSGNYLPVLCGTDMSLRYEQEVIPKTVPTSGIYKDKTTRLTEVFASVSGLSPVNSSTVASWFYLMQESIRTKTQSIRATFRDQEGNSKQISGTAIIVSGELTGPADDFAQGTVDFEFSGGVQFSDIDIPAEVTDDVRSDYWTTTAGATSISGASAIHAYSLSGKTILSVDREGIEYDLVTSTPFNRQCKQNADAIEFDTNLPFNAGETVFVVFK